MEKSDYIAHLQTLNIEAKPEDISLPQGSCMEGELIGSMHDTRCRFRVILRGEGILDTHTKRTHFVPITREWGSSESDLF